MDQLGVEGVEEGRETPQSHVVSLKWLCVQHLVIISSPSTLVIRPET